MDLWLRACVGQYCLENTTKYSIKWNIDGEIVFPQE